MEAHQAPSRNSQRQFPPPATNTATNRLHITTTQGDEDTDFNESPLFEKIFGILVLSFIIVSLLIFFVKIGYSEHLAYIAKKFRKPTFLVESVRVYPFHISSSYITANWSVVLHIRDPYSFTGFYFENMEASVLLKNESVCSTVVGNLYLDEWEDSFKAVDVYLESSLASINQTVAEAVMAEQRENGVVTFSLKLECVGTVYPSYDAGSGIGEERKMMVLCKDLKIRFFSDIGTLENANGPISCDIFVLD
ncbi:hypothetical protein JCGZ_11074 [Jatropha curcas]|uniref:Late embryogenesis abundant protein LEA-2 subgroup domain-containing protein n=1 Tax=Jatropha curcas TaxID=180498 RepID=A0A067KRR8_JATCU|nr:hypothetical protein JCGZ_11074 [Jatropha curcas]